MKPDDFYDPDRLHVLTCRPALPKDTPGVLELTRTIWEGHDYVPHTWSDWLKDPAGLLVVAESGGRVVGLAKLTRQDDCDWWEEGLRVHPDLQGRGIASHLHDTLQDFWLKNGAGTLRFVTSSTRLPVQHLAERTGYEKLGEITSFGAEPITGNAANFIPLAPGDSDLALAHLTGSESLRLSFGLIDLGWEWASPTRQRIEQSIERHQAWWWKDQTGGHTGPLTFKGLLIINDDDEDGEIIPRIEAAACPVEDMTGFLEDYRSLAGSLGYPHATWAAPLQPELLPHLERAGFKRDWEGSIYLYARLHPKKAC